MHMRCATEIPDHRRSLDLPDVPHAIISEVVIFAEGHVQRIEATLLDELHGLRRILLAEGKEEIREDFAHEILLIRGQGAHRNAIEPACLAGELHSVVPLLTTE